MINGYNLFCRDRNCHGGGVLCYINENIPSKTVKVECIVKECKMVLIEFFIKTRTWLFIGPYKPPSQNENNFLSNLSLIINRLTCQYENYVIGDFNMTTENKNLNVFMNSCGLECLIKNLRVSSLTIQKEIEIGDWNFRPSQFDHYCLEKSASHRKRKNKIIS